MQVSTRLFDAGEPAKPPFGPATVLMIRGPGDAMHVARLLPGESLAGQLLRKHVLPQLPEFAELGIPIPSRLMGIELLDLAVATATCDARSVAQRLSRVHKALPRVSDTGAHEFTELIRKSQAVRRPKTNAANGSASEKPPESAGPTVEEPAGLSAEEFATHARAWVDRYPSARTAVRTAAAPADVLEQVQDLNILLPGLPPQVTAGSLVKATERALAAHEQSVSGRAHQLLRALNPYARSLAAVNLLDLNANGALPERVHVLMCPEGAEYSLTHQFERLTELIESLDEPAMDLIVTEPIYDLGCLDGISAALGASPRLLGGVFVGFQGYADKEHLRELAADMKPQGTISAGRLWVYAGRARHKVVGDVSLAAILGGLRCALDARLDIKGQMWGPLIPLFGAQAEKEVHGIDELDTACWTLNEAVAFGDAGFNVLTRNRKGFISPATARTRSSLPVHSYIDPVRVHGTALGTIQRYMENEARGDLSVDAIRRHHCEQAVRLVPLHGVPGFSLAVSPRTSAELGLFEIDMASRLPDVINRFKFVSRFTVSQ